MNPVTFIAEHPYIITGVIAVLVILIIYIVFWRDSSEPKKPAESKSVERDLDDLISSINNS